jgi:hypothetical protein
MNLSASGVATPRDRKSRGDHEIRCHWISADFMILQQCASKTPKTHSNHLRMSQKGEAVPATEYTGNGMSDNHFLSLTTWSWVSRLIKLGSNVQFSDLDQLQPEDTAKQLQYEMWSAWEAELKQTERKPSLWRVLWSVFRVRFISMGLIMLPYTAASILQPMMLFQLVKFVSDPTQTIGWGFLWCCIMLLATATQFNCHHWYPPINFGYIHVSMF